MLSRHDQEAMSVDPQTPAVEKSPSPEPEPAEDAEEELGAEKLKELGNVAFKASRFHDAIELYTRAIGAYISIFLHATLIKIATPTCSSSYLPHRARTH